MEILNKIQRELRAPKGQRNTFGNYNYRSCEDILEAVKPLLGTAILTITDEIVNLGDRYYVKATATLMDGKESMSTTAYARECLDRKGMDASQITGATSSYARKYSLNGLFLIDDTKDADHTNEGKDTPSPEKVSEKPTQSPKTGTSTVPPCPECGQPMRSTAQAKASGKMKSNGPIFTCSDYKNCKGVIWAPKKDLPDVNLDADEVDL